MCVGGACVRLSLLSAYQGGLANFACVMGSERKYALLKFMYVTMQVATAVDGTQS